MVETEKRKSFMGEKGAMSLEILLGKDGQALIPREKLRSKTHLVLRYWGYQDFGQAENRVSIACGCSVSKPVGRGLLLHVPSWQQI